MKDGGFQPDACEQVLAWVCDALDGAPGVPHERVAAHLAGCERCRAQAALLHDDDAVLGELGRVGAPLPGSWLQRLQLRLRALPVLTPGGVNDRHLSDAELDWLAAAGTGVPEWLAPKRDD